MFISIFLFACSAVISLQLTGNVAAQSLPFPTDLSDDCSNKLCDVFYQITTCPVRILKINLKNPDCNFLT